MFGTDPGATACALLLAVPVFQLGLNCPAAGHSARGAVADLRVTSAGCCSTASAPGKEGRAAPRGRAACARWPLPSPALPWGAQHSLGPRGGSEQREGWGTAAGVGARLVSLAGAVSEERTCAASTAAHNVTARGWREPGRPERSGGAGRAAGSVLGLGRAPRGRARAVLRYHQCWAAAGVGAESSARLSVHPEAPQAAALSSCAIVPTGTRAPPRCAGGRGNVEGEEVGETPQSL